ncbi:MAG: RNA 3'-terminal phosphate cyclase [Cellvibrionaceae bacterium]|nr:RNA 3'-terminal phosphate cyclase [Cellvibrionaceae bacterium]MCV6626545.1 RNA 3'-terminal phosphate cyclase [Cellvibrionaceae bacterium]
MIEIDGSQGEGGGQIFRSALTLSMCLGRPVRIHNIRARRAKPGLLRQHLCCLRAASQISGAQVSGDEIGASEVCFKPSPVSAGSYQFAVGSAGSTSLVMQTILLPLAFADEPSELLLQGGTHNGSAPSYDYIEQCFLPVLETLGYRAIPELKAYGFYPAGGGAWKLRIEPVSGIKRLLLTQRGEVVEQLAVATSSRIPVHVNERELEHIHKKLLWPREQLQPRTVPSQGPGNIVSLRVRGEGFSEIVEVVGEKQLSAERVAGRAVQQLKQYLAAGVPVGEHLADQLLLPMALGNGGVFTTVKPSDHLLSNKAVIEQFMDIEIKVSQLNKSVWQLEVNK